MPLYGAVELGGTKTLVAVGEDPSDLEDATRVATTDPETTLGEVVAHLSGQPLDAVGIASFGPLEVRRDHPRYGTITTTPKPGWPNTPVLETIRHALGVPVAIDTDVNGAGLGEGRWGAAAGLTDFVYITVGTGIGGGVIVGGRPVGAVGHPELGHVTVAPLRGDEYGGRCPYHGRCLEGMACGPALQDRFGPPDSWTDPAGVLGIATHYVAQGVRNVIYTIAPQRVIVGGGVSEMPGFHDRLRSELEAQLAGYPQISEYTESDYVLSPGLGDRSGLAGALVLAASAAE